MSRTSREVMANLLELAIEAQGKSHVLERLNLLTANMDGVPLSKEEEGINLMFVYFNDEFGLSDIELLTQFVDWMENDLLKEMQDG